MLLTTAALLSAGVGLASSGLGAGMSAYNTNKARKEEQKSYNQAKNFLNSQYYRDPLSTVGNRAILKTLDQREKDSMDALNNRAVAGGATMENQLAARQANNEVRSNLYSNLLANEDARKDRLAQQQLGLDMRHSANLQNSFMQNAQNWQAWGSAAGNSAMDVGSTLLYGKMKGLNTVGDLFKTT